MGLQYVTTMKAKVVCLREGENLEPHQLSLPCPKPAPRGTLALSNSTDSHWPRKRARIFRTCTLASKSLLLARRLPGKPPEIPFVVSVGRTHPLIVTAFKVQQVTETAFLLLGVPHPFVLFYVSTTSTWYKTLWINSSTVRSKY